MSWLEPIGDGAHAVRFATLVAGGWSTPATIASGRNWFVNWADFPSVVPISGTRWVAHWLPKRPGGTYAYDVALAFSADRGRNWSEPVTPHSDNTPTEHGFVSLFPWNDGVGAVWLDGRNMRPDPGADGRNDGRQYGGMTLRFARMNFDGEIVDEGEIDDLVCECCQTDIALTDAGPIVAYRDRGPDEIRDIAVTRYLDGRWTAPVIVSDDAWRIPGCPVNGPAIAASGNQVALVWYGAPNRQRRVKIAWSINAGKSFEAPAIVDEGGTRGRVDVVLLSEDRAMVSWISRTGDDTGELRVREVSADGQQGPINVVSTGGYARNSGFPQMTRTADRLVLAWPQAGEPAMIKTALANIDGG